MYVGNLICATAALMCVVSARGKMMSHKIADPENMKSLELMNEVCRFCYPSSSLFARTNTRGPRNKHMARRSERPAGQPTARSHDTSTSHQHHINISSTAHLQHIHITSKSHRNYINITSKSYLHHIYITSTLHLYHINITSTSRHVICRKFALQVSK